MGQEIANTRFKHYDFHRFGRFMAREMEVLRRWFDESRFSVKRSIAGLELEAWLIDAECQPTPWNEQVIALTGLPQVVPELSRFNVEFNVAPRSLSGYGLEELANELGTTWNLCDIAADRLGASVLAIGVLPTLTDPMLSLANMSKLHRYQALNEQVLRLRQGKPIRLSLQGQERLLSEHRDVMLESATTSFQLHLQVPLQESVRYYNAAIIASAATVAVASNSPLLFGSILWEETRIPLFEQAVDVGNSSMARVTFGSGYARESLVEVFAENEELYPVLLPLAMDSMSEHLAHIRLQNGTIWRWNRPLIGFDDDGTPHLRIEHRVMASGPTLIDMTANMALFYGLVESLAQAFPPPEQCLPFAAARDNFYRAARHGLDCEIQWLDGEKHRLVDLFLSEYLPRAAAGLERLQVDPVLSSQWMSVIEQRVRSGQTGAVWQRRFLDQHGKNFADLVQAYRDQQRRGEPVHTWSLERSREPVCASSCRSMLRIVNQIPQGLLKSPATELADLLGQPTLIHLAGRRPEPLFLSILLHGNEDVGLRALQLWAEKQADRPLPRALSIFIGNVDAAKMNVRHLPNQPDYNRIWPSADRNDTPEHAMMRHVVAEMRPRGVFASIDLHNNTGSNPHYSCLTRLDTAHLQLAALFGRTTVYFQRPRGVQTMAFSDFAPAITCECGKVGDENGVRHAADFLDACLHLAAIPNRPLAEGDLYLFHTVATINVPNRVTLEFDEHPRTESQPVAGPPQSDLALRGDLERLNFQELDAGSWLGRTKPSFPLPLAVTDQTGRNVTEEFLMVENGRVLLRKRVIPAMLTCDENAIRQDCLGYLMERYQLPDNHPARE